MCDRFSDATFAYQGGGHGASLAFLQNLESGVQRGLKPDLTLLLDAPVKIGLDRISGREHDHFEREQRDFFERVRKTYLARAAAEPERFCVIDASRPRLEVEAAIARELIAFADRYKGTADNTT
jgi:dTMP kinase